MKGVTTVKHYLDKDNFRHILMSFNDKMTQEEIDDVFEEFEYDDDGQILTKSVVDMFVAGGMDEKKEEEKKADVKGEEASVPAADAAPAEGGKKKKKKKKAAK